MKPHKERNRSKKYTKHTFLRARFSSECNKFVEIYVTQSVNTLVFHKHLKKFRGLLMWKITGSECDELTPYRASPGFSLPPPTPKGSKFFFRSLRSPKRHDLYAVVKKNSKKDMICNESTKTISPNTTVTARIRVAPPKRGQKKAKVGGEGRGCDSYSDILKK